MLKTWNATRNNCTFLAKNWNLKASYPSTLPRPTPTHSCSGYVWCLNSTWSHCQIMLQWAEKSHQGLGPHTANKHPWFSAINNMSTFSCFPITSCIPARTRTLTPWDGHSGVQLRVSSLYCYPPPLRGGPLGPTSEVIASTIPYWEGSLFLWSLNNQWAISQFHFLPVPAESRI